MFYLHRRRAWGCHVGFGSRVGHLGILDVGIFPLLHLIPLQSDNMTWGQFSLEAQILQHKLQQTILCLTPEFNLKQPQMALGTLETSWDGSHTDVFLTALAVITHSTGLQSVSSNTAYIHSKHSLLFQKLLCDGFYFLFWKKLWCWLLSWWSTCSSSSLFWAVSMYCCTAM